MRNPAASRARRYVALLRGINVGGRNRVAMPRLRQVCESMIYLHLPNGAGRAKLPGLPPR